MLVAHFDTMEVANDIDAANALVSLRLKNNGNQFSRNLSQTSRKPKQDFSHANPQLFIDKVCKYDNKQ